MASFFRRAGAELAKFVSSLADPSAVAGSILQYAKDVSGTSQLFARDSAGVVYQMTPPGVAVGSIITPASISGTVNDYAVAGFAGATLVRQDLTAVATVTGIAAAANGRQITFVNINTTQANLLIFAHENAGSSAANRFLMPSALDWYMPIGAAITFVYDGVSSRWRPLSFSTNVFPAGTLANPGLVVGATPTRGWRDAGTTVRSVNAGADVTSLGNAFGVTGAINQSGGQVTFSTGASGFINTGQFSTSGAIFTTGFVNATLSGGTVNDWSPTITSNTTVRTDLNAATAVTGLSSGVDGKVIIVQNISTVLAREITFTHEDVGSLAANRFNLPNQASVIVPVGGAASFRYDGTSSRWRLFGFAN